MTDSGQLPAGINTLFICRSKMARDAIIAVVGATSGITPATASDTPSAQHAKYAEARARVSISVASDAMMQRLGDHHSCVAIYVDDPTEASVKALTILEKRGLQGGQIHSDAASELPPGFITFVTAPGLDGIVLVFWPKDVSPEVSTDLPVERPWTNAELLKTK